MDERSLRVFKKKKLSALFTWYVIVLDPLVISIVHSGLPVLELILLAVFNTELELR